MSDTDASWPAPMTVEEEMEFLYFLDKVPPEDRAALLKKLTSAMKDSPGDDDTDGVKSRLATKMTSAETEDAKELDCHRRGPACIRVRHQGFTRHKGQSSTVIPLLRESKK